MRLSISLLASLGLVGSIAAQATNDSDLFSGTINYTTRSALPGTSIGDILNRFDSELLSCLGQYQIPGGALVHRMNGWKSIVQDQGGSTQELFTMCLLQDDAAAPHTPDASPAGTLLRTAPIATPTTTVTGPIAWFFTITLATPYDSLPQGVDFHLGIGVPANAAWTADGVSNQTSIWGQAPIADQPYLNGPNPLPRYVSTIDRTGSAPIKSGNNTRFMRTWWFGPAADLRCGADVDPLVQYGTTWPTPIVTPNPNFGAAGMYPDQNVTRLDGLAFRVRSANHPGALYAILGNIGGPGTPFNLGLGWNGDVCVQLFALFPFAFATGILDTAGAGQNITFAFPNSWAVGVGEMHFQAAIIDSGGFFNLSNGAGFIAQ